MFEGEGSFFEQSFNDVQAQLNNIEGLKKGEFKGSSITYEQALSIIRKALQGPLQQEIRERVDNKESEQRVFKKKDLKEKKRKYYKLISDAMDKEDFSVAGMSEDEFINYSLEDIVGYSVLADAFEDKEVDDIFVISWDVIYVEKNGTNERYAHTFRNKQHYHDFIERILQLTGLDVNNGNHKIVHADFYEDRLAIVGESVAPVDMHIAIRKHKEDHIMLDQIIDYGVMSQDLADLLGIMILGETNIIYAGITGSGKTTSLRALIDETVTKANKRMLVAETQQELFPQNPHTVQMVTSPSSNADNNVNLRDLVMTALRLKPKYIVVGEVQAEEAEAAVEAMETGHSTLFTMHGGTAWNIVNRLVTKYLLVMPSLSIEVVERTIGSAVDYIAIQDDIPGVGRRVTSIHEVTYDFKGRVVVLVPIVEYDFESNSFVMINKLSPLKGHTMKRRGVDGEVVESLTRADEMTFNETKSAAREKNELSTLSNKGVGYKKAMSKYLKVAEDVVEEITFPAEFNIEKVDEDEF